MKRVLAIAVFVGLYFGVFWALPGLWGGVWLPWWGHVLMFHGSIIVCGAISSLIMWAMNTLFGGRK